MSEDIVLLGGTGSIGLQTIDVSKQQDFHIVGISLNSRIDILNEHLKDLPYLKYVAIINQEAGEKFKLSHPQYQVLTGVNANLDLLDICPAKKVVNSLVGFSGLLPSLHALRQNKTLCLANKESLVIGGDLIKAELQKGCGKLYPIDSEHVALSKLLKHVDRSEVKRMIITASGGALRNWKKEDLSKATLQDVLNHPTWNMGVRITTDSCTMVNKGFEFIEASYLFDWDIDNISPLINEESEIHSALEFNDSSYLFEVGPSDMRIPISYALNETKRVAQDYKSVDFNRHCSLNFRPFDYSFYPLFQLVLDTFKLKKGSMAFFNAVDEEAIKYFAQGQLTYPELLEFIQKTVAEHMILIDNPNENDLIYIDEQARKIVKELLK